MRDAVPDGAGAGVLPGAGRGVQRAGAGAARPAHACALPLVIPGIGLSTLHQSSLGSLFLIDALPPAPAVVLAAAAGAVPGLGGRRWACMMVIFESHTTAYLYRAQAGDRGPARDWPGRPGGSCWLYLALRFGDLAAARAAGSARRGGVAGGDVLDRDRRDGRAAHRAVLAACESGAAARGSGPRQASASPASCSTGSMSADWRTPAAAMHFYMPAWTEFAVSAGVVAGAGAGVPVLRGAVRDLGRASGGSGRRSPQAARVRQGRHDVARRAGGGRPHGVLAGVHRRGLAGVRAAAAAAGDQPWRRAACRPGGRAAARRSGSTATSTAPGWRSPTTLHEQRDGGQSSCVKCHHMNLPRDRDVRLLRVSPRHVAAVGCVRPRPALVARRAAAWPAGQCHATRRARSRGDGEAVHRVPQGPGPGRGGDPGEAVRRGRIRAGHARALHRAATRASGRRRKQARSRPGAPPATGSRAQLRRCAGPGAARVASAASVVLPRRRGEMSDTARDRARRAAGTRHVRAGALQRRRHRSRRSRWSPPTGTSRSTSASGEARRCYEVFKNVGTACASLPGRRPPSTTAASGCRMRRASTATGGTCHYVVHLAPLKDERGRRPVRHRDDDGPDRDAPLAARIRPALRAGAVLRLGHRPGLPRSSAPTSGCGRPSARPRAGGATRSTSGGGQPCVELSRPR